METFTHVHASGRYDRPAQLLGKQVEGFITNQGANIITLTETERLARKHALHGVATRQGYGIYCSSANTSDDATIMWDEKKWKVVHLDNPIISKEHYFTQTGKQKALLRAKVVVLENISTKKRLLVSVTHLASHVQSGNRFYRSARTIAWYSEVRHWSKVTNAIYPKYNCDAMLIAADWNVDLKNRFFRSVVKGLHRGMKFVYGAKFPTNGTLGKRIIDFAMYKGKMSKVGVPHILNHTAASDHTPYMEKFSL